MIIDHPGPVTDRILLLGRRESCVYLLDGGKEYALLGGGFTYIAGDVMEQLKHFEVETKKIKRIVILHSHFDHCGIVPYLKRQWPWVEITASQRAKVMLSRPNVIENIKALNQMMIAGMEDDKDPRPWIVEPFQINVENVAADQAVLSCGDRSMVVSSVPGHSSCAIAVFVPEEKAMFPSDAAGIPFGEGVLTAANSNFDDYMKSLEKIFSFDTRIMLTEHFGARSGEDYHRFKAASLASAVDTRKLLEASFERTGDVKKSTDEITQKLMAGAPEGFLSEGVISLVVGQMLNYISRIRSNE